MTIEEIFKSLNLPMKGRNWAQIRRGVTLHLTEVAGQVLWVVVANYQPVDDGWIDLDKNTVKALAAVIKRNKAHMIGFYACIQIIKGDYRETAKFTREVWNKYRVAPAEGEEDYMDGVIHFSHVKAFANRHLS